MFIRSVFLAIVVSLTIVLINLWSEGSVAGSKLSLKSSWLVLIALALTPVLYYYRRHTSSPTAGFQNPASKPTLITDRAADTSDHHNAENELGKSMVGLSPASAAPRLEHSPTKPIQLLIETQNEQRRSINAIALDLVQELINTKKTDSIDIVGAMPRLASLLRETGSQSLIESRDIVSLIDDIRLILKSVILRERGDLIITHIEQNEYELDSALFVDALKILLLHHLCEKPGKNATVNISHRDNKLCLNFSDNFVWLPQLRLGPLLSATGGSRSGQQLHFPATIKASHQIIETHIKALIVSEQKATRENITIRLQQLGVSVINDFDSPDINFCFTDDTNSEIFRTLAPHLANTTEVVIFDQDESNTDSHPGLLTRPLTQNALSKVLGYHQKRIRGTRVLIVDDSEPNRSMLEMQLNELGVHADTASSGEQALAKTTEHQYSLIFMDNQMPGLSGEETTIRLRETDRFVTIVGLTAHATPEERQAYLAAGMDDVLQKPANIDQISSLLSRQGTHANKTTLQQSSRDRPTKEMRRSSHRSTLERQASNDTVPVVDRELSLKHANDRSDLAAELFGLLIDSLPDDQRSMAACQHDLAILGARVHKLHGAVRFCGVPRLEAALASLEQNIKSGDEQEVAAHYRSVDTEITALLNWHEENGGSWVNL
ncbi:MAG: CheY-like chemotaxis protein [Candidatus Azotimanducaceae bacterium]|jgi:CheY-like chemotaxis protein